MLIKTHNRITLPDSNAEMKGIDIERDHQSLEDWLVNREDWPALSLDDAVDDAASVICSVSSWRIDGLCFRPEFAHASCIPLHPYGSNDICNK